MCEAHRFRGSELVSIAIAIGFPDGLTKDAEGKIILASLAVGTGRHGVGNRPTDRCFDDLRRFFSGSRCQ